LGYNNGKKTGKNMVARAMVTRLARATITTAIILAAGLSLVFLASCAHTNKESYDLQFEESHSDYQSAPQPMMLKKEKSHRPAKMAQSRGFGAGFEGGGYAGISDNMSADIEAVLAIDDEETQEKSTESQGLQSRKIHYTGMIHLETNRNKEILDSIETLTQHYAGVIQTRNNTAITVQIPVDSFQIAFDAFLNIAKVIHKSITAADITNQYNDVELRKRLQEATLERLQVLLANATDDKEKIELLKEISRVSKELHGLTMQMEAISKMAAYSTITILLVGNNPSRVHYTEITAFEWIHLLDPFKRELLPKAKKLKCKIHQEAFAFVDLSENLYKKGPWRLAGSEGTELWAWYLPNKPQGDTQYWIQAIEKRLAPKYRSFTDTTSGEYAIREFIPWDDGNPFVYQVAVRVKGDRLQVLQVFFPNKQQKAKHQKDVNSILQAGCHE
jgi:hypothetical protein